MPRPHNQHREEVLEMLSIFKNINKKYDYLRKHASMSSFRSDTRYDAYRKDLMKINLGLKACNPISSYFITRTFTSEGTINNEWWKGFYPKSTFYRLRYIAIVEFLAGYHSED